jgi:hypothetical protein
MLALNLIFGNPIMEDILGIVAGHLYYFLTVLQPLAGGNFKLNTPLFVYPFLLPSICNSHNHLFMLTEALVSILLTYNQWRRQGWPGRAMAHPKINGNY